MRICAGRFKGRSLRAPRDKAAVRPTSERTRQAVFNMLLHRRGGADLAWIGADALDAFAGTGALGLEALSRGAAHVTFIDSGPPALAALKRNIAILGAGDETTVLAANALWPPPAPRPCALAFVDPPYGAAGAAPEAMAALAAQGWFAPGALAVVETAASARASPPAGFALEERRIRGGTQVTFFRYRPEERDAAAGMSAEGTGGVKAWTR